MSKNPKLKDRSDRELLELIISNQTNIAQFVFRMNSFFCKHYGEDYINQIDHKLPAFDKLLRDEDSLLMQIRADLANED